MVECGGVYTEPFGTIQSPAHPDDYYHLANCTWSISVPDNMAIRLK